MLSKLTNTFATGNLSRLYLKDDFADFTFTFGDEKVPVHKAILASASPVFCAMFFGQIKDKVSVEITDSNAVAFKEFLQLFYSDEVTFSSENIDEVVKLADKYDMLDCIETCAGFLADQLMDDNMLSGYKLAISLKNGELKQKCEEHLSLYGADLFKSDGFLRCDRNVLKSILQLDSLVCNEIDVLNACLSWAKYACQLDGVDENNAENLRSQLGDCLYQIRFTGMNMEDFAAQIILNEGLLTSGEFQEVACSISVPTFVSNNFSGTPRSSQDPRKLNRSKMSSCVRYGKQCRKCVPAKASLVFSVSTSVLLGTLNCDLNKLKYGYNNTYEFTDDFEIEISEMCNDPSDTSADKTVLVKRTGAKEISFDPTLIIYPHKLYEIRSEIKTTSTCCMYSTPWHSEYIVDNGFKVTIHNVASSSDSVVTDLNFQRI